MELIKNRPRILLLIDKRNWAFHTIANAVMAELSGRFSFTLLCSDENPLIDDSAFDIIHIFYDYETYHRPFMKGHAKIIRSVYSHYWEEWNLTPFAFYREYLQDAHAIMVPSKKLYDLLKDLPPAIALCPEGVDTKIFRPKRTRTGPLILGWAGDPTRTIKRLPWLRQACDGLCELRVTDGTLTQQEMVEFYNNIDVIACSSIAEGCPRPLLEGMACGCFPITFDVGIAAEVINHGHTGWIVQEESVNGLRSGLHWYKEHIDTIRSSAESSASIIASVRSWKCTLPSLAELYCSVL